VGGWLGRCKRVWIDGWVDGSVDGLMDVAGWVDG
jgi:hypothetical protein